MREFRFVGRFLGDFDAILNEALSLPDFIAAVWIQSPSFSASTSIFTRSARFILNSHLDFEFLMCETMLMY